MPNKSGTSTLSSRIKLVWADHTTSQLVLTSGVAHYLLQPVKPLAKYLAVPLHFLSCSIHVRKCSGSPRGCQVLVPLVAARSSCHLVAMTYYYQGSILTSCHNRVVMRLSNH